VSGLVNNFVATVVAQDTTPTLASARSQTFYGFRYDNATGKLTVEEITSDTVIRLPSAGVTKATDYKHWVWSESELNFSWDSGEDTDRLLVEVR